MVVRYFLTFCLAAYSALAPAAFVDATATSKIGLVFEANKTPAKYLIETMGGGVVQTWKNVAANQIFVAKEAAQ